MPYKSVAELPAPVRDYLPKHAQEIYVAAFNSAWNQYKDPEEWRDNDTREEVAHQVAWAAVKHKYEKNEKTGDWQPKKDS